MEPCQATLQLMPDLASLKCMLTPGLPLLEKILRPIVVYVFLIAGLRLAGKRELAQLNPFDLVVLLTLSNAVQNAIIGDDNSITGGLIGATTLLVVNYAVVRFLYRHEALDKLIEGAPDRLIQHGRIIKKHLERELITLEELAAAARKQGIESLREVEEAVLEAGGTITFVARRPSPGDARHDELIDRLETLSNELAELRKMLEARKD